MKKQIGPAAIVGAVVVLAGLMFGLYRVFLAPRGPDPAAAAAEHQNMADFYKNQGKTGGEGAKAPQ
jgi:hypothetical protein